MSFSDSFKRKLYTPEVLNFEALSIEAFRYQWNENTIYRSYCQSLGKDSADIQSVKDIPFLPISFFKNQIIKSGKWEEQKTYLSSGTTNTSRSRHFIRDERFYLLNTIKCFQYHFGSVSDYQILALLPSYQEQGDSSLIAMIDYFMQFTTADSGYFIENDSTLVKALKRKEGKTMLFGVTYALLDFAERNRLSLADTIIMETGGMKGRRKEIIRAELHQILGDSFSVNSIHSEYGMTELLSQAYSKKNGLFSFPPWTKAVVRDTNDPFQYLPQGKSGGLNIIDLANIDSCCFIETQDLARIHDNDYFEVLGRFDNSDIRGCNLMIA